MHSADQLGPLRRAKWNLAVLAELAAPCQMELAPVRDPQGRLVDFQWRSADPLAALTLGLPGTELSGQSLLRLLWRKALGATLFQTYELAVRRDQAQVIRLRVGDWSGMHRVRPTEHGITVVLTSSSAVLKVIAAQRALQALERPTGSTPEGVSDPAPGAAGHAQTRPAGAGFG